MRYIIFFLILFLLLATQPLVLAEDINIPLPFQTTKDAEQEMIFNGIRHKIQQFQSNLSRDEIVDFYKSFLTQSGWKITTSNIPGLAESECKECARAFENSGINMVVFSKGDYLVLLTIPEPVEGKLNYVLNYSYGKTKVSEEKDNPGKDLDFVPRYPGSVRYTSMETKEMTMIHYRTKDSQEQIAAFYQGKMPKFGWKGAALGKGKITPAAGLAKVMFGGGMVFESEKGYCYITVSRISDLNLNNIAITFIPRQEEEGEENE